MILSVGLALLPFRLAGAQDQSALMSSVRCELTENPGGPLCTLAFVPQTAAGGTVTVTLDSAHAVTLDESAGTATWVPSDGDSGTATVTATARGRPYATATHSWSYDEPDAPGPPPGTGEPSSGGRCPEGQAICSEADYREQWTVPQGVTLPAGIQCVVRELAEAALGGPVGAQGVDPLSDFAVAVGAMATETFYVDSASVDLAVAVAGGDGEVAAEVRGPIGNQASLIVEGSRAGAVTLRVTWTDGHGDDHSSDVEVTVLAADVADLPDRVQVVACDTRVLDWLLVAATVNAVLMVWWLMRGLGGRRARLEAR